jgi:transposase-like protein
MAYPQERKEAILKKLLPPINKSVAELAKEEGIPSATIYNWRVKANQSGVPLPRKTSKTENWTAETKLSVVIETATLSESELSQYCREKGLYSEQVRQWKTQCLSGFTVSKEQQKEVTKKAKSDQLKIKSLKKELRHKEKALAETAALLVLRKKLDAFWETSNEDD